MTEYSGLTMKQTDDLRRKIREAGGQFHIVKNTLGKVAFQQAGLQVSETLLSYGGLEWYGQIAPGLYLGAEVGYTNPDEETTFIDFDPFFGTVTVEREIDLTYVPIELNLKYAIEIAPNLVIDFGAGVSGNYAEVEVEESVFGVTVFDDSEDDWLFGGQFFADLNYKFGQFFLGVNAKYQITEDLEIDDIDTDVDFSNWRVGGQIGVIF